MNMGPRLRKFVLTLHVATSVGWVGAVLAYILLDLATRNSQDAQTLVAAYVGMEMIATWALLPLAVAAFVTGLVISVWTPWGLFRHYWVIVSLLLTALAVVILLVEMRTIRALAAMATDPTISAEGLRALPSTLPHSVGGLVVLVIVLALNIYKPRGMTRYGWRKQREERSAP